MRIAGMDLSGIFSKEKMRHLWKTLKYSLYVIVHPFDGFWDLTHEKRGSLAAANVLTVLLLFQRILSLQITSFQFADVNLNKVNMWIEVASVLAPMLLWTVSNWSLTTLMDGKGRLRDVYMGTAYAFTPTILIGYPMMFLSNVMTVDEGVFYYFFTTLATVWSVCLVIAAMMMIHDYSLGKTVFSCILTLLGIAVIVFIMVIFFSLISDGIAYFVSLYKEIVYRFY